jgi:hypothetical protein
MSQPDERPLWAGLDLDDMAATDQLDWAAMDEAALLAWALEAREVLRDIRWSADTVTTPGAASEPTCPCCGRLQSEGCNDVCRLAALLDTGEAQRATARDVLDDAPELSGNPGQVDPA